MTFGETISGLKIVGSLLSWLRGSRDPEKSAAAREFRLVLLSIRAQLDPLSEAELETTPATHEVVRGSMSEVRRAKELFAPYLREGAERDRFESAFAAFVEDAETRFEDRRAGPLSWLEGQSSFENAERYGIAEGIRATEANLRREWIGRYDVLLEFAKHR